MSVQRAKNPAHFRVLFVNVEGTLGIEYPPYASGIADALANAFPHAFSNCRAIVQTPVDEQWRIIDMPLLGGLSYEKWLADFLRTNDMTEEQREDLRVVTRLAWDAAKAGK